MKRFRIFLLLFLTTLSAVANEYDLMIQRLSNTLREPRLPPEKRIRKLIAGQRKDGTWHDVNYAGTNRSVWELSAQLGRAYDLACHWSNPASPFYHDRKTGETIVRAVNWWNEKRPRNSNWWWNDMWAPKQMSAILLLAPELFPEGPSRKAALDTCAQAVYKKGYTGNNLLFIAENRLKLGLLARDPEIIHEAAEKLKSTLVPSRTDGKTKWDFCGIRADGCYHQHGPQIQFGNYGGEFFRNMAFWSNIFRNTEWQFSNSEFALLRHLAFNGFQWVLWNGRMDLLAIGRQLGQNAAVRKGENTLKSLELLRTADPSSAAAYDAVLSRNRGGRNSLTGNRHFWNSDYMVHRRPEWYAAVRMNSVRVRPVEDDTNWDNALGRYFSDGVCLVMRSGLEYEDITPCWDWTRLPGTTLPKTPVYTEEESRKAGLAFARNTYPRWTHSRKWRQIGETEFVGGVSDGIRGVAVFTMKLDGVSAKKAYFFDTDAVYQLGCDISSTSPFPVATTVNTCLRQGGIECGKDWFLHDGIGYHGKNLKLITESREGDWRFVEGGRLKPLPVKKELFSLRIEHGIKPENASYAFAVIPNATPERLANWPRGKILSNTSTLQAVELSGGVIGLIFHRRGKFNGFETDSPGLFLIAADQITVADPTAQLNSMTLRLNGQERRIELPSGEEAGRSITVQFRN